MTEEQVIRKVNTLSGQNVFACDQCGKCTATCPFVYAMDRLPRLLISDMQTGNKQVAIAKTPWICNSCFRCTLSCNKGIDIARLMEALRQFVLRKNIDKLKVLENFEDLPRSAVVSAFRRLTG